MQEVLKLVYGQDSQSPTSWKGRLSTNLCITVLGIDDWLEKHYLIYGYSGRCLQLCTWILPFVTGWKMNLIFFSYSGAFLEVILRKGLYCEFNLLYFNKYPTGLLRC